jgi:D-3-phosphoglycerate dehydrogenase
MAYRVLATARSFCNTDGPHFEFLTQNDCSVDCKPGQHPLKADELRVLIPGYDGAILGLDICDASVIEYCDKLKVISRYGSGVDQVDLEAASRRGIAVTNTPGANKIAVAELAIGLMFSLARNIPQVASAARENIWKRGAGWELSGKTLGVIGFGEIGREVAARALALGMRVIAYDPFWSMNVDGIDRVELAFLLANSDVVTLHTALTPDTEHLINATSIAEMKPGAYMINTARGQLIDEQALYDALKSGRLGGAAVDVLHDDPPTDHPLLKLENFIATPHIGATTRESVLRMAMHSAQNLVAVLRGEPCKYIVNAKLLEQFTR